MKQLYIFWILFLVGCSRGNASQHTTPGVPGSLLEQGAMYCDVSRPRYQELKYVHSRCDGVGFTSLRSVACGDADLSVFSDPATGELFRDPEHTCWLGAGNPENGSKSGLSRDMTLMRLYAAVEAKDLAWLESFIAFGNERNWMVCDADDLVTKMSRCQITPGLVKLIYDARDYLRGGSLALDGSHALVDDFEAHLRVISYRIAGRVYGALTDGELADLKALAKSEPNNGLFQAIYHKYDDGKQGGTIALLEDEAHWPVDRLPTSNEHCENYLYQRSYMKGADVNSDWLPCPDEGKTHEGTEFSLTVKILGQED